MDIFDLIGPIMVGPSSSHTAGAVRIGLACRRILDLLREADGETHKDKKKKK